MQASSGLLFVDNFKQFVRQIPVKLFQNVVLLEGGVFVTGQH
jgi:hypothetical protein